MYPLRDHPDIECALRTGYPSWMRDLDVDDDGDEDEYLDGYYNEDALYEERRDERGW